MQTSSPTPAAGGPGIGRNPLGLRPGLDDALINLRANTAKEAAPHSGALFSDQHRKRTKSDYPGQSHAHDVLRDAMDTVVKQASAASPLTPLGVGLHMISAQLHVTLPGPELTTAFPLGGYSLLKGTGKLSKPEESANFADNLQERREQTKQNVLEAAKHLSKVDRQRMVLPSPPRDMMTHGGKHMDPPSPTRLTFDSSEGSGRRLSVDEQRKMVRQVVVPLMEGTWTPANRGKGQRPPAFHGSDITEAVDVFKADKSGNHSGEVGSAATKSYLKGQVPEQDAIRVKSAPSAVFHKKKKSGAHEIIPTNRRKKIAKLPDFARTAVAMSQADARTRTALTIFRGRPDTPPAPAVPSSNAVANAAPASAANKKASKARK